MTYPFVQAKDYQPTAKRRIDYVVIHDMEAPEKGDTAESCARYFHDGPPTPSSAHYCVDDDSIVQCVHDHDIAFHAPPNLHSIGVEHAGYQSQTAGAWKDGYSLAMLTRSARLVADLCQRYEIPPLYINAGQLKNGKRGITMHRDVSKAFRQSTHTDPGINFPMSDYIALVRGFIKEDDVALTPQDKQDIAQAVTDAIVADLKDTGSDLAKALRNNARIADQAELVDEREGDNPGQTPAAAPAPV